MLAFTDFSLLFLFPSSLLFLFSPFPLTFSAIPRLSQLTGDSPSGCNFVNTGATSAWPEETHGTPDVWCMGSTELSGDSLSGG